MAELVDILASGDVDLITLTAAAKAHAEGQLFYDPVTKALSFHNDVPGVTLNIGQEQYARVFNDTGATILNGKACTHDGAYPTLAIPKARLAQADSFVNAQVLGIATHDIPDQTVGILTTHGSVSGIDTSVLTVDAPAYLSDTVPGDFTSTPPDIITKLGGPLVVHATNGAFFVLIRNTIAIPPLFGILTTIPDPYDLTTAYQELVNYQTEDAVTIPLDKLLGTISPPNSGRYRGSFTVTLTVPTATSSRTITVQAWNKTQGIAAASMPISIPRDTTAVGRSFALPFTATANDVVVMRIKSSVAILGVIIDSVSFDIESIHVV